MKEHFKILKMSSVSPTDQDLSNDTTFSQLQSCVPVPLGVFKLEILAEKQQIL